MSGKKVLVMSQDNDYARQFMPKAVKLVEEKKVIPHKHDVREG